MKATSAADGAAPFPSDKGQTASSMTIADARFIALLIFTQLPNVLSFTIALPLLAGMARELAHDAGSGYLVKLVSGVLGPSMAIGALLAGWLADKTDRRWLLMGIGTLYVFVSVAPAVLGSLELIVAARFFTGMTASALMAIGLAMVADYLPEHRRAGTLGMLSALNMVASLLSLPAAGFVGNSGWRLPFLLYLLAAPVVFLASLRALPVPERHAPVTTTEGGGGRRFAALPGWLFVLALAVGTILTIPGIYVSFHLTSVGLGKTSTIGLLMMMNSMMAAGTSALFGRGWRRSPRLVFCLGFSAMGVGLIMLAYAAGFAIAVPALLLMGAGMGLLAPSVMAQVVDTVEEGRRTKVVGVIQGTLSVAPLLVLTGLEPLLPLIGTRGVMLLVGILALTLFARYALLRRD
jgi:MFS family permease